MFGLDFTQMFILSIMLIPPAMLMMVIISTALYNSCTLVKQRFNDTAPINRKSE